MNNHEIAGVIFLIKYKERFLLEQRDDNSDFSKWSWVFPGGKKEEGEDTLQTVLREAEEEFGIELQPGKCKKIETVFTHLGDKLNEIWQCEISTIKRPLVIGESAGMGWYSLEEIRTMRLGYHQTELVIPVITNL